MTYLKKNLSRFLDAYGLPPLTRNRPEGWAHFLHLYARVIEDIPLVVSLPPAGKKVKNFQSPKHISRLEVRCDEALVKHGAGKTEMLFTVAWTVHDKNGRSGEIFVINSFALKG